MSVEFEGDQSEQSIMQRFQQTSAGVESGMERWLLSTGLTKTPEMARRVLVVVIIVSLVLTVYILKKTLSGQNDTRTPEQIQKELELINANHVPPRRY